MRRVSHSSYNAGFTLLEALAATLLMAFVLSALATVTAQWLPNWNRGLARAQRIEIFATGLERLVADLAAAEFVSAGNGDSPPIFDGTSLSATFVRTALGPNAGAGLEIVRFAETAADRGPAMVRTTAPFVPLGGNSGALDHIAFANPVVVVRSPYRVSFSYAGPDRVWRETWQGQAQLPRAVRITVRDVATSRTLAVSTSTLIWAELPSRCASPRTPAECPVRGGAAETAADARDGNIQFLSPATQAR